MDDRRTSEPAEASSGAVGSHAAELMPPELADDNHWHVFISHSSEDFDLVQEIDEKLTKLKYKCQSYEKHFLTGTTTIHNIIEAVQNSHRVLLMLTPRFFESKWVEMEVAMTLQKSQHHRKCLMIGLVADMKMDDVPPYIRFTARCFEMSDPDVIAKLQSAIQDDMPINIKPSGNVAHGLAWGYFYGYFNMILEGLSGRLADVDTSTWSDKTEDESLLTMEIPQDRVFKKFVIVMPNSCFCPSRFADVDANITAVASVPFKASRAGNPKRSYPSTVYKVIHPQTGEVYFFAGEFSTPLHSIYEMASSELAILTDEDKRLQRLIFAAKVQEIVNHESCSHCNNTTLILDYNDVEGDMRLSEKIANAINKEIEKCALMPRDAATPRDRVDVFILHVDDDHEMAVDIQEILQRHDYTCNVYADVCLSNSIIEDFVTGIHQSRRVILIVSTAFLEDKMRDLWSSVLLEEYNNTKRCITIPVIADVTMDNVPDHIKLVATCLHRDDKNFEKRLLEGLARDIPTTALIPAGNIATGMAWTYFYGYLNLVVPGLESRMKEWPTTEPTNPEKIELLENTASLSPYNKDFLYNRLVLIIPTSCRCPDSLDTGDGGFTKMGTISYKATRAGVMERPYETSLWKVVDSEQSELQPVYCACEYVTPILTMYNMTDVAGINEEERNSQRREFHEHIIKILELKEHYQLNGKVVVVVYDDLVRERTPLSTEVYKKVRRELEKQHMVESVNARSEQSSNSEVECLYERTENMNVA